MEEELTISRQFPLRKTLGGIVLAVLCVILGGVLVSFYNDSDFDTPFYGSLLFFALFLLGAIVWLRPLVEFLFDPRPFVIGTDAVRFGNRSMAYSDMAELRRHTHQYAQWDETTIKSRSGVVIKLRWLIWADADVWNKALEERSLSALLPTFEHRTMAGERVTFGKVLALDRSTLYVKGKAIPIHDISSIHYQTTNEIEVSYRVLYIQTRHKLYKIEERKIVNAHLFIALAIALIEGKAARPMVLEEMA